MPLIDLTIAYTNALRLQLNLRSVATRLMAPNQTPQAKVDARDVKRS